MTLRELLWRYQAVSYQSFLMTGSLIAGVFNARRRTRSDRWFTFKDFHPSHVVQRDPSEGLSGREVVQQVTCWFQPGTIQWAEGWSPEML